MKIAWFHKPSTLKDPSETVQQRLDRLEAGLRQLVLEWEDTYERVMRALRRLNKRHQDLAAREDREQAETHEDAPGATQPAFPGLDPISRKILERRARVPPRIDGQG